MKIFTYIFIFIMLFFGFVSCMYSPSPQQPIVDPKETERCLNAWKYALSSICNKDAGEYFETLHFYACNHNTPMISFLMKRENEKNKNLRKALFELCDKDITAVNDMNECVDAYKSLKSDDFIIKTAKNNDVFFYKVALRCGARLNVCDSVTGYSLFGMAAQNKAAAIVFELLSNEAVIIDSADVFEYFEFFKNRKLIFDMLIHKQGFNVNMQDEYMYTLLHYAVMSDCCDMVEQLLKHTEIRVNNYNMDMETPLHIAVEKGLTGIVTMLLSHKDINITLINGCEKTASAIAKDKEYYDIVLLLQQHKSIGQPTGFIFL